MKSLRLALQALPVAAIACSRGDAPEPEPPHVPYAAPPEQCAAPDLSRPEVLAPCNVGQGALGAWALDGRGLPAYDYGIDQDRDPRAITTDTVGDEVRDHWAQIGNWRITALVHNDGRIEVTHQERGAAYLNKSAPEHHAFSGGFSYLDDGEATWCTAYGARPPGSVARRRFGVGYAESGLSHRGVRVERTTTAPPGDATFLIDEVVLTNETDAEKRVSHYEYWDVARLHVETQWMVSGSLVKGAPKKARELREGRNAYFDEAVSWDGAAKVLGLRRRHASWVKPAPKDAPSDTDLYPTDPFLAVLSGEAHALYTDDTELFGGGTMAAPDAVTERRPGSLTPDSAPRGGLGQPRLFAVRSDVVLPPRGSTKLRFAYGYTDMGAPWPDLGRYRDAARDPAADYAAWLRPKLMSFATPKDAFLQREAVWHAAQLEASVAYRDYWGEHVVPQGSAYLFLHGADGALRDTALYALPLVYTDRALAKEQLRLAMGLAFAKDARFTYAFQGHGRLDDAMGIHSSPSDLDLFFLLALTEYLDATGDVAFLDERVSYFPKGKGSEASVLVHAKRSAEHLLDHVGFGEHGLIRLGSGDWSDGVTVEAPDYDLAKKKGESIPNSQMALTVLPRVAHLLRPHDGALAERLDATVSSLRKALDFAWKGTHFARAYYGNGKLRGDTTAELESQVWGLIDRDLDPARRKPLLASVRALDDSSEVGAPLTMAGAVWPAISQLLTWGYTRVDDGLAWSSLVENSLTQRGRRFPNLWYQLWSGPDGADSQSGETWASIVTPMKDFPTMNNNVHAMALFASVRVAGLEPIAGGLRVQPHVPHSELALRTELVDLDVTKDGYRGTWRPRPGASRVLRLEAPRGTKLVSARVAGADVPIVDGVAELTVSGASGGVRFEVATARAR